MSENYRPRSPDFSSAPPQPLPTSYEASPFFTQPSDHVSQQYVPPFDEMARRSSRLQPEDAPPVPEALVPEPPVAMSDEPAMLDEAPQERLGAGIEVKTKFPVARIKRIMQADEDVGKVAQVTPIAVCKLTFLITYSLLFKVLIIPLSTAKALELFMITLVTKAAAEAKDRNSKRVTASHLKHAVAKDEVLDFLADIISKVPDQPQGRKQEDDGSDQNEGRRKRGGRRPKEESD